ncbi:sensor domain-containing diguanylate cyclase [Sulfurospirillum deleyianum]|uniref:diguanylate cyclase n=1 Tax=Sulfurospirillum deleyianum (strain ATCC 51133 / DSM 6946 / 5175) TaxID=525898 RepID=D1B518_SULD5|nr:diguanylate cyclase [Sulfurospirillum deleyianum]ACZ13188.1 diguanylate cyclase [Sulfurospirillum deleyianum DSM 6946]
MNDASIFLKAILNSMTEQIAVLDFEGNIVFVNQSWIDFSLNNDAKPIEWESVNYLKICEHAAQHGDTGASKALKGILKIIHKEEESFYLEYPCHSPTQKRWFMMRVTPLLSFEQSYVVIAHHNITERKIAENAILNLSKVDGLTKLPNYRAFSQFLSHEWRRAMRTHTPLTMAMIDIDYFKYINDTYGHLKGDEYLRKIAHMLQRTIHRPSDLCARYGGEEFVIILGDTPLEKALGMMQTCLEKTIALRLPNPKSPIMPILTLSIGVVSVYPKPDMNEKAFIQKADELLYLAKKQGRNQLAYEL